MLSICISLMANNVKHLFTCWLAFWVYVFLNCPFIIVFAGILEGNKIRCLHSIYHFYPEILFPSFLASDG